MGGDGCRDRGGQEGSWKVYISNPGVSVVIGVGETERSGRAAGQMCHPGVLPPPPKKSAPDARMILRRSLRRCWGLFSVLYLDLGK